MIQEMHERLKKANERRNCGADDEITRLRAALAAKDAEIERLRSSMRVIIAMCSAALGESVEEINEDDEQRTA